MHLLRNNTRLHFSQTVNVTVPLIPNQLHSKYIVFIRAAFSKMYVLV